MSIDLIESERRTQRSVRSTFVSVAVHACLISLAVYASASATEVIARAPIDSVIVFSPVAPGKPKDPGTPATHRPANHPALPSPPLTNYSPATIDDPLPPVDASAPIIDAGSLFPATATGDSGASGDGTVGDPGTSGEPLFATQVEKPALPRSGNPPPKYPSLLEHSRVEGAVLVQFVVDTLGVPDMGTFNVLEATNDLFAESTRTSVAKWRFSPAEAGGRKVAQIVQLPLRFVAPPN